MEFITKLPEAVCNDILKECIKDVYSCIKNYKKNMKQLEETYEDLRRRKDDINRKVEIGRSDLGEITNEAQGWLESVKTLIDDEGVKNLVNEDFRKGRDKCCCGIFLCNLYRRYDMSRSAKAKVDEMLAKMDQPPPDPVTLPTRVQDLEPIPNKHFNGLESREKLQQIVLAMLKDDNVDAVGICGMGGAGKTTLAKEIRDKGAQDMFDTIVMVEISEEPNIERIQDHIAAAIGLSLDSKNSIEQRAISLYNSLKRVKPKRNGNEQSTKILIILDNIWKDLKLTEVGIPHERTGQFCCKLLFTGREKTACHLMGVLDKNIVDVEKLEPDEARRLFRREVGNVVDHNANEIDLEDRLLKACDGLPLAISVLAKALRCKKLSEWIFFADELEKPIACRNTKVHEGVYKILGLSYKFISNDDYKKRFFLLACLFPLGSIIPIEDLMRYGIGLGLFQRMNSLTEAMKQADRWVEELISSSLLLEDDRKWHQRKRQVKIHDVVRASVISIAKEDKHMLMVDAIPRWSDETCQTCTAISLTAGQDYGRLNRMEFEKLETLLLRGSPTLTSQLDDAFFQGMKGLKVLVLSDTITGVGLPKSITGLTKLRVLHLENCELRDGDIELISELVGLHVLSLRGTIVGRLPDGIKKLSNLRLLDLSCCWLKTVPANVIGSLPQLEGLYMGDNNELWQTDDADELKLVGPIKVLELGIVKVEQLPTNDQFVKTLENFKIHVGCGFGFKQMEDRFSSALIVDEVSMESLRICKCLRALLVLSRTDYLDLNTIEGLRNLVPDLDTKGFRGLKCLEIRECNEMDCLISTNNGMNMIDQGLQLVAFPKLENLYLSRLSNLKRIYDGEAPPGMFSNLRQLKLDSLPNLESYVLPVDVARNLTTLTVSFCDKLKYIWMKHDSSTQSDIAPSEKECDVVHFPCLKSLELSHLFCLRSVLGEAGGSTSTTISVCQALFSRKIVFPSLEKLDIEVNEEFVNLWDVPDGMEEMCARSDQAFSQEASICTTQLHLSPFPNLKSISISWAFNLKALGGLSIATALVQLESLSISYCDSLEEVINKEREEAEISSKTITFPKLKVLKLDVLKNIKCFYGGSYEFQFPALKILELSYLHSIRRFAWAENSTGFFPNKMKFPCLEEFKMNRVGLNPEVEKELWSVEDANAANPKLEKLTIVGCQHFRFSSGPGLGERPPSFSDWHLPQSICDLTLGSFDWKYLISVNAVVNGSGLERLLHLEIIEIRDCNEMKAVVQLLEGDEEEDKQDGVGKAVCGVTSSVIVFPRLKSIRLRRCQKMRSFSSAGPRHVVHLPSLETVKVTDCTNMESFSFGHFDAPQLTQVQSCNKRMVVSMPKDGDINNFLFSRYVSNHPSEIKGSVVTNRTKAKHQ